MSQPTHRAARGRPRDPERERAILEATLALLAEVGYERLTLDAVAARARASRATIYRRWADKRALVVAAIDAHAPGSRDGDVDTGTLRDDLLTLCRQLTEIAAGVDGRVVLGLLRAGLDDPVLCDALEASFGLTGARLPPAVIDRAVRRGELPEGAAPFAYEEVVGAVLIMRITNRQPVDDTYLQQLVDRVLLPALAHGPRATATDAARALFSGAERATPNSPRSQT